LYACRLRVSMATVSEKPRVAAAQPQRVVQIPEAQGALPDVLSALESAFAPVLGESVFTRTAPPEPVAPPPPAPEPEAPVKGKAAAGAKGKPAGNKAPEPKKPATPVPAKAKQPITPENPPRLAPEPLPPPPPDEFSERADAIRTRYQSDIAAHRATEQYLLDQKAQADACFKEDLDRKDAAFTRFWRYTGLPMPASHLALDASQVASGHLLNPKAIVGAVNEMRRKEVLSPAQVFEFNDATAAPHYLAQTAANEHRAAMRAELIEQAKESMASSKALSWHKLPAEQVQELLKASRRRHKLSSLHMPGARWPQHGIVVISICSAHDHAHFRSHLAVLQRVDKLHEWRMQATSGTSSPGSSGA
jgi:hypothetical protein